jgi:hypothetical protein
MEQSESIKELAAALAAAQGKLKAVAKTGKGNYGKYAELAPTLEQVLPVLSENGLSVTQMPVMLDDGTTGMTTMLMHKSGEWMKSTYPVRMQQQTPQAQGSAITYARRYALMAVIGIAGDDDDGQAGTDGNNPETRRVPAKPAAKQELVTKDQLGMLFATMKGKGYSDRDQAKRILYALAGVESLTTLSKVDATKLIDSVLKASRDDLDALDVEGAQE